MASTADAVLRFEVEDNTKRGLGGIAKGLASVINPAGLATAGIGAFTGSIIAAIKGASDFEKELRPMVERSRISAESLQLLTEAANRAGSEDGLEGITDSAQELQLQLGEIALTGKGRALEAFQALGLSWMDLQAASPEEAFRTVLAEIQKIPNVANRAIAAEEIFGGSSEKLAGIINLTAAEFAALEEEVRNTTDFWDNESVGVIGNFNQEMNKLQNAISVGANTVAIKLLPAFTSLITYVRTTALPTWNDFRDRALAPVIEFMEASVIPVVLAVAESLKGQFVPAMELIKSILEIVAPIIEVLFLSKLRLIADIWTNYVQPALQQFEGIFRDQILPILQNEVIPILRTFVEQGLQLIATVWETALKPALDAFLELLTNTLIPVILNEVVTAFVSLVNSIQPVVEWITNLTETFTLSASNMSTSADSLLGSLGELFTQIRDIVQNTIIPLWNRFAEEVFPLLKEAWEDDIRPALIELEEIMREHVIPAIQEMLKVVEAVLPVIAKIFTTTIAIIIPIVTNAFELLVTTIGSAMDIIQGIISVVTGLITGDWRRAWNGIKLIFEGVWNAIRGILEFVTGIILGIFRAFGIDLERFFTDLWGNIVEAVRGFIDNLEETFGISITEIFGFFTKFGEDLFKFYAGLWSVILDAVVSFMTSLYDAFQALLRLLIDLFIGEQGFGRQLKNFFLNLWNLIRNEVSQVLNNIATSFLNGVRVWLNTILEFGRDIVGFFSGLWNRVRGAIQSFISNVASALFNGIRNAVSNALSQIPGSGAISNLIPGLHEGGIVTRPTLALIGEAGPEAVIPLDRLGNVPVHDARTGHEQPSGGGGMLVKVDVHVAGGVYSDDLETHIVRAVNDGIRQGQVTRVQYA